MAGVRSEPYHADPDDDAPVGGRHLHDVASVGGRAAALAFAKEGAHVIALARTQGGLEELDDAIRAIGGQATLVPADLKDLDGIDRLGPALLERWGKLDIFVGNAAILGPLSPLHHVTAENWQQVIDKIGRAHV